MQTFLPYADFARCAAVLDRQRLGKQRIETKQILFALLGNARGWTRHPATLMWKGFEPALALYGACICVEWVTARGYEDAQYPHFATYLRQCRAPVAMPPWLGSRRFHEMHRALLLRKAPEHYRRFWPRLDDSIPFSYPKGAEQ